MSDFIPGCIVAVTIIASLLIICGTFYGCDQAAKSHQRDMLKAGYVWRYSQSPEAGYVPAKEAQSND